MLSNEDQACLVSMDFDKTIAKTFEPCPGGVGVERAYDLALYRLFGEQKLLGVLGGLKNRAATEIVRDLLVTDERFRRQSWVSYGILCKRLGGQFEKGLGIPLVPLTRTNECEMLGEMLVRLKLEILEDQIGQTWPKAESGVLGVLERFSMRNIPVAIVSSGHDRFIRKCFKVWGAPCPPILITDDLMRGQPLSLAQKIKPSPVLIDYAMMSANELGYRSIKRSRCVHIGDDYVKDGMLAWNANIDFWWYASEGQSLDVQLNKSDVIFTHWREIEDKIQGL